MSRINVIVATTKPYAIPADEMYIPLQVGAKGKSSIGYLRDDTDENISEKNPHFCELTGLYWAWKNLDFDALGLVHYRRYLGRYGFSNKRLRILSTKRVEEMLHTTDVIVGKPRHYFIETNWSQYVHAHCKSDLINLRKCIDERFPKYLVSFDTVMKRKWGHRFNIFVMKKPCLNEYCEWLFSVLEEMEKKEDPTIRNDYQSRVYGFLGERLLDVWIEKHQIVYTEMPVIHMECQQWCKKIYYFLKRKYKNKPSDSTGGEQC